jgi:hypothetical protein
MGIFVPSSKFATDIESLFGLNRELLVSQSPSLLQVDGKEHVTIWRQTPETASGAACVCGSLAYRAR